MVYATAHHNIDVLGAAVKELNLANNKLNKNVQANLSLKYEHDEKMMQVQLQRKHFLL
jgi:hypothetical protein